MLKHSITGLLSNWPVALFFLVSIIFMTGMTGFSQSYSPYFNLDQHQKYTEYLINSGKLKISHPLSQPFVSNELADSMPEPVSSYDNHWLGLMNKDLRKFSTLDDSLNQYGKLIAGVEGGIRGNYDEEELNKEFYGSVFASYGFKNFGLYYRFDADEAFKNDALYFGSTGKLENPIYYRTSEAYLKWDLKNISLFIGRSGLNCGIMNEPSLIISDNPLSYDRIGLVFSNRVLKFTTFLSRLDDIYGYDVRDSIPVWAWNKRYLSMHRFEISITPKLEFAFTETVLYGGKDQDILFQYLNPVNIFYLSKLGERKGYEEDYANAFASLELYYKPMRKVTLYGQFMIDDMDFTQDLRAQFPDRLGFAGKLILSDLFPGSQIYLTYNRISNWTYNSFYTFGNYTYFGKSLGYPKNGDENLTLGMEVFRINPFILSFDIKGEREREQDLQGPFIGEKTDFPIGVSQNSLSTALDITWFPKQYFSADLRIEYLNVNNYQHIEGDRKGFFNLFLRIHATGIFMLLNR